MDITRVEREKRSIYTRYIEPIVYRRKCTAGNNAARQRAATK